MNTAGLIVSNLFRHHSLSFLMQSDECYRCKETIYGPIEPLSNQSYRIDTRWSNQFSVFINDDNESTLVCQRNFHFRENVSYLFYLSPNTSGVSMPREIWPHNFCHLMYLTTEADANIPLYVTVSVLLFLVLLGYIYSLVKKTDLYKRTFNIDQALSESPFRLRTPFGSSDLGDSEVTSTHPGALSETGNSVAPMFPGRITRHSHRLKSLDAFRGLALTIMIFVNYGGGGYWFFRHSIWNGLTVADLVFPWFVFIMGTAIAIVFKNVHSRPLPKTHFLLRVLKRSLILFTLGLCLNSANTHGDLSKLRVPGVLQRIAISYLITAFCEILFSRPIQRSRRLAHVVDQFYLIPHWVFNLLLVILWCSLTFGLDVPDCGRGYIGPGGIGDYGNYKNCSGGAAKYIDEWLFGDHVYRTPTFQKMYQTNTFYDPEGILGSLTSIFICFLGLLAGKILVLIPTWRAVSFRFAFWGIILGAITLALTSASKNGGIIPINKNLWSLSYVLGTGALAFGLLLFFYIIIDVTHVWSGEPFIYPGMNSILIYVCHEVFHRYFPVSWSVSDTHAARLPMDIWGTAFWVITSYILYRKNIFVSV